MALAPRLAHKKGTHECCLGNPQKLYAKKKQAMRAVWGPAQQHRASNSADVIRALGDACSK